VYEKGENGSPIIALNAALEQERLHPEMASTTLMFLFIEQKDDRAERLQENVTALQLPSNFHVKVVGELRRAVRDRYVARREWHRGQGCAPCVLSMISTPVSDAATRARVTCVRAKCATETKACVNLGSTYLHGTSGVKADLAKAVEYYRTACVLGDQQSCDWVAKQEG
jgi:hypothetical protein